MGSQYPHAPDTCNPYMGFQFVQGAQDQSPEGRDSTLSSLDNLDSQNKPMEEVDYFNLQSHDLDIQTAPTCGVDDEQLQVLDLQQPLTDLAEPQQPRTQQGHLD